MTLPDDVGLIPPEAHESWNEEGTSYGGERQKLLTDHNPYYIPTNLIIAERTSILFLNADTPWDAPHPHTVKIVDASGNAVYNTGTLDYTDNSEPKMIPVGDYTMINTDYETYDIKTKSAINIQHETKKATISVKSSPLESYKERVKPDLVVGGFYTPTDQITNNKDKYGNIHPGWFGYYKTVFPINGFTILSYYIFNYSKYLSWPAEGWDLKPTDHTLIIYGTEQPLSDALVKLKRMVRDNAYISDLHIEQNRRKIKYWDALCGYNKFSTYENISVGIKVSYPSYWKKTELNRSTEEEGITDIVEFGPPEDPFSAYGKYAAVLYINVRKLHDKNIDPITFSAGEIFRLKQELPDFKIMEGFLDNIGGMPGYKILFSYSMPDIPFDIVNLQAWVVTTDKAYTIVYHTRLDLFYDALGIINKMINSFEFIEWSYRAHTKEQGMPTLNPNFLIYHNSVLGIKTKYPAGWITDEQYRHSDNDWPKTVVFMSPSVNKHLVEDIITVEVRQDIDRVISIPSPYFVSCFSAGRDRVTLEVGRDLLSKDAILDAFVQSYTDQFTKKMPKTYDFALLESMPVISISNNRGRRIVYSYKNIVNRKYELSAREEIKTTEVFFINNDKIYRIVFTARLPEFEMYSSAINQMIDSFEIVI